VSPVKYELNFYIPEDDILQVLNKSAAFWDMEHYSLENAIIVSGNLIPISSRPQDPLLTPPPYPAEI
jgi:hypothetical protein